MRIHTVKEGDTVFKIARQYSVPPSKIIENNCINEPDRLYPGQKLVILTPTRSYTVRGGDTLEKIALRFGVDKSTLLKNNPSLMGSERIYPGQIIAVKYDTPKFGNAVVNGYYYEGCPDERLSLFMPYLTYITLSGATYRLGKLNRIFNYRNLLSLAKKNEKIPILRVYTDDCAEELFENKEKLFNSLIEELTENGFSGICLAAYNAMESSDIYAQLLLELKRLLLENDIELHLELDGNREFNGYSLFSDIADVALLNYAKGQTMPIPSFEDGEERVLRSYAEGAEGGKTLVDMSHFAYFNGEEGDILLADKLLKKSGAAAKYSDETKMCSFTCNRYSAGKREPLFVCYAAPENIEAKLDLIGELGYLGVSFDMMRAPVEHLMMFHTDFHSERGIIDDKRVRCSDSSYEGM